MTSAQDVDYAATELAGQAYAKYALGDPMTDEEVAAGAEVSARLAEELRLMGVDFILAKRALWRFASEMIQLQDRRAMSGRAFSDGEA